MIRDEPVFLEYDKSKKRGDFMVEKTRYFVLSVMLMAWLPNSASAEQLSQDWVWSVEQDYAFAATNNNQKRIFGQFCYYNSGLCAYIVDLGITCKKSDVFPALVNTDAGSRKFDLICDKRLHDSNVLIIKPFKAINSLVTHNKNIGFAVALRNGQFKVVHFSLRGSKQAIKMMRSYAKQNAKPPSIKPDKSSKPKSDGHYL